MNDSDMSFSIAYLDQMSRKALKFRVVQPVKMRLHVAMRLNGRYHLNTTGHLT
jgi:hypothetical protein